jgi:hypothetical protein
MKTEVVQSLTEIFEGHAQQTDSGVESNLHSYLRPILKNALM